MPRRRYECAQHNVKRALAFNFNLGTWRKSERSEAPGVLLGTGRNQKIDAVTNAAFVESHRDVGFRGFAILCILTR
jgi:hypothetical protein